MFVTSHLMKGVIKLSKMAGIRRMKSILPSLREKKRYLVFEVISERAVQMQDVFRAVYDSLLAVAGEAGVAVAGVFMPSNLYKGQRGVARVSHVSVDLLRAALCRISQVGSVPVIVRSVGVSGSLKTIRERYFAS